MAVIDHTIEVRVSMATVKINHRYTMADDELKTQLDKLAAEMDSKFQLACHWQQDNCLQFKRGGASGEIVFKDNQLTLTIKLGLMLSAFKSKIQTDIQKFMHEHIH